LNGLQALNLSPDINIMAQALTLPHGTLSTPVLTQGHTQQHRSPLEQSYAVLSWPFTPESTPFMTLQRLLAQLQQQLAQQQQQIQQIQFMQQQFAQSTTVFPQSPLFSHPQTLPQQHSLLDNELQPIQPGLGVVMYQVSANKPQVFLFYADFILIFLTYWFRMAFIAIGEPGCSRSFSVSRGAANDRSSFHS
jgi:hypothetical protein